MLNVGRSVHGVEGKVHSALNGAVNELHGDIVIHPSVVYVRHPVQRRGRGGRRGRSGSVAPVREVVIVDVTENMQVVVYISKGKSSVVRT